MRVCVIGAGAVGGYFGARLARSGHDVVFLARGAHLEAIRARGLTIRDHSGEWRVKAPAEEPGAGLGEVDVVVYAVKTYSNPEALPLLAAVAGDHAVVLTLQNGVDSPLGIETVIGHNRTIGGAAYVATARTAPGVIVATGAHRRIAFGETAGDLSHVSTRCLLLETVLREADIVPEPFANGWVPLWEKFIYLAPFAAFTSAARQPIGPLWTDPDTRGLLVAAFKEVAALATAERVPIRRGTLKRILTYVDSLHPTVRSSMLIDIQQGRRTEVEALVGSVVRRARRRRIKAPIMTTLYAALREYPPATSPQASSPGPVFSGFPR